MSREHNQGHEAAGLPKTQISVGEAEPREGQTHDCPIDTRALVAVDLGADSCRISLLRWRGGRPAFQIVHRFANAPHETKAGLVWKIETIYQEVLAGLRTCAEIAQEGVAAIGVDGWAVDYVRLKPDGVAIADPFCYRDQRTVAAEQQMHQRLASDHLYELTGIQLLRINTLYQLVADKSQPETTSNSWVNLPEYILYKLGGQRVAEYTNATHTQLVSAHSRHWCPEVFEAAGLDIQAAPPIVPPGTNIGQLSGPLQSLPSFRQTRLIAPACHDTASAIAGIPAVGDDWAFISSGTWSLVGTVLPQPCINPVTSAKNFTNEGGIGGQTYFLKNVNGMWLIRQCLEYWRSTGSVWTIDELVAACQSCDAPEDLLDVDDPDLLLPGNMPARINAQLVRSGNATIDESAARVIANLIFHSLAARYAEVLSDIGAITGKHLKRLFIVGGGSKNKLLNQLIAAATGLQVIEGAVESSTIGNFAIQIASLESSVRGSLEVSADAVAHWANVITSEARPIVQ